MKTYNKFMLADIKNAITIKDFTQSAIIYKCNIHCHKSIYTGRILTRFNKYQIVFLFLFSMIHETKLCIYVNVNLPCMCLTLKPYILILVASSLLLDLLYLYVHIYQTQIRNFKEYVVILKICSSNFYSKSVKTYSPYEFLLD